jgi:Glycosyl transferase 4-like domain
MLSANSGAGDVRVARQAETLVEAGCSVTVFCRAGPTLTAEEQIAGVRYVRLKAWHWPQPAIAPFLQHQLFAATFGRAVAAAAPDLIHAHGFATLPAAVRAAARCRARVIYDIRSPEVGELPAGPMLTAWIRWLEQRALRRVAATIAASRSIAADKARSFGIPQPTLVLDEPGLGSHRQAKHLIEVYDAVARGPRGLPLAMAQRALATCLRPAGAFATGN